MNKSNLGIGLLALSAVILMVIHWALPQAAQAQVVAKERDYVVATAPVSTGGDALYIVDNRTNQVAVFSYDTGERALRLRAVRNLADAFLFQQQ